MTTTEPLLSQVLLSEVSISHDVSGRVSVTQGLSLKEVEARLEKYGKNEIPEKKEPLWLLFGRQFVGPMPFMLELCCVLAIIVACSGGSNVQPGIENFVVIFFMIFVNACIGFYEERKAQISLDGLKDSLTATVSCTRGGVPEMVDVALLVPGDIITLRGGNSVPADAIWRHGDTVKVDTASLTGEPIPWSVPRPDKPGEPDSGKRMLGGFTIVQGECTCEIEYTGLNTEIGKAASAILETSGSHMSYFESRIMTIVNIIISVTLTLAVVVFIVVMVKYGDLYSKALLMILSLIIGAVPIALPLVLQVTMAIGAGTMAKHKAIVTHLTALQEIASMTVLNSDKTGTLTTAKMDIMPDQIFTLQNYTKEDILLFGGLSSNAANLDDPVDRTVLKASREYCPDYEVKAKEFTQKRFIGFNALVKRTVGFFTHPTQGELIISKGLVSKVLRNIDEPEDPDSYNWEVSDYKNVERVVKEQDVSLSVVGYKTIGIAISRNGGPMEFVGLIPMLDPPRHDTKETIARIKRAGIEVKMITGDHLNIAKETARLIDLGVNIHPNTDMWPASSARDDLIMKAHGFAQVMPKDKQEVILVEQNFGLVVGMTGDGVNDAAALSQAQVGIAVADSTDAAKNAADMILVEPGLSAIYTAVYESRKIFQRLKAYVLYRMAATISIVIILVVISLRDNKAITAIEIVLLALLNDVSLIPISTDKAVPSPVPDVPKLFNLLFHSFVLGCVLAGQSFLFYYGKTVPYLKMHSTSEYCPYYPLYDCCHKSNVVGNYDNVTDYTGNKYCTQSIFQEYNKNYFASNTVCTTDDDDSFQNSCYEYYCYGTGSVSDTLGDSDDYFTGTDVYERTRDGSDCGTQYRLSCLYLQISFAFEFLILCTRTDGFGFFSLPSNGLICGIIFAQVLAYILVCTGILYSGSDETTYLNDKTHYVSTGDINGHGIEWSDGGIIFLYDIIWVFIIDLVKMASFYALGDLKSGEELDAPDAPIPSASAVDVVGSTINNEAIRQSVVNEVNHVNLRQSMAVSHRRSNAVRYSQQPTDFATRISTSLRPTVPSNVAQLLND